jgi:hypothetical protein
MKKTMTKKVKKPVEDLYAFGSGGAVDGIVSVLSSHNPKNRRRLLELAKNDLDHCRGKEKEMAEDIL